jgi:hypothetical protein
VVWSESILRGQAGQHGKKIVLKFPTSGLGDSTIGMLLFACPYLQTWPHADRGEVDAVSCVSLCMYWCYILSQSRADKGSDFYFYTLSNIVFLYL